jgi:hypothetical protein
VSRSPGQDLHAARLERGLTLEDVSAHLKIRVHLLDAMERDALEELPGPPFGEKFLAQYRAFVGLAPLPPRVPEPTPEPMITREEPLLSAPIKRGLGIGVGALLVLLLLAVIFRDRPASGLAGEPDMRLYLTSVDQLRVRAFADGRELDAAEAQVLRPGKKVPFDAYDRLEVELPRLEGVTLRWRGPGQENDIPFKPLGGLGSPRKLVFIDDRGR